MVKVTIVFGALLIGLGVLGYVGSGSPTRAADESTETAAENAPAKKSITALFPAAVGGLLLVCGVLALKESRLKHAMHGAAMVGVLGTILGLGRGSMGLGKFFSGDPSLNQRSFLFVWLMTIICAVFVFLCVQSFRAVRKQKAEAS